MTAVHGEHSFRCYDPQMLTPDKLRPPVKRMVVNQDHPPTLEPSRAPDGICSDRNSPQTMTVTRSVRMEQGRGGQQSTRDGARASALHTCPYCP